MTRQYSATLNKQSSVSIYSAIIYVFSHLFTTNPVYLCTSSRFTGESSSDADGEVELDDSISILPVPLCKGKECLRSPLKHAVDALLCNPPRSPVAQTMFIETRVYEGI